MGVLLESFLPGRFELGRGAVGDYRGLERFHYRGKGPATWAGVWVVRYLQDGGEKTEEGRGMFCETASDGRGQLGERRGDREVGRVVAAAVLSYPSVNSFARDSALGLGLWERGRRLRFVNENVRVISRVVVHPQFRSLGLASRLVRFVCEECSTRFVEAFAVMGRVHPFFEKGGMRRVGERVEGPVYYLFDRLLTRGASSGGLLGGWL